MDELNLDEKSLSKWWYLQHCKICNAQIFSYKE